MIIVDTDIVSALLNEADREVIQPWLDRQDRDSVWTGSRSSSNAACQVSRFLARPASNITGVSVPSRC